MKVLGIVCSPRKGGNTEIMMGEALAGARSYGAETELWTTAGKELTQCDACQTCSKRGGECHIKDDMQELYPRVLAADGLIFGSPSYFLSVTAQAKTVIDRLSCLYNESALVDKVAGILSVAAAIGHEGVWAPFINFIEVCHMVRADKTFGFADKRGEIRKDRYAMKSSEELGKQVVSLIKQQFRHPEEYKMNVMDVCDITYGISAYPFKDLK